MVIDAIINILSVNQAPNVPMLLKHLKTQTLKNIYKRLTYILLEQTQLNPKDVIKDVTVNSLQRITFTRDRVCPITLPYYIHINILLYKITYILTYFNYLQRHTESMLDEQTWIKDFTVNSLQRFQMQQQWNRFLYHFYVKQGVSDHFTLT